MVPQQRWYMDIKALQSDQILALAMELFFQVSSCRLLNCHPPDFEQRHWVSLKMMRNHRCEPFCSNMVGTHTLVSCVDKGSKGFFSHNDKFGGKKSLIISHHHCFSSRSFVDQWRGCGTVIHFGTSGFVFLGLLLQFHLRQQERTGRKLQRKGSGCRTGLLLICCKNLFSFFCLKSWLLHFSHVFVLAWTTTNLCHGL